MADFLFNQARGRGGEFYYRVDNNDPANSALILVVLRAASIETDAVLKDKDTLSDVLSGATDEATNSGYARKTITDSTLTAYTPDDTNDWLYLDMPDQTWSTVGVGDVWSKLLVCYDSDTTSGTDANIVPWLAFDFAWTPDGTDITWVVPASGFYKSV
jgi:Flp pilus assembly protein TadG